MKLQRMLLALAAGLGLTLALNHVLAAGWEATAASVPLSAEHFSTKTRSQAPAQLSQTGSYPIFQAKKLTATDAMTGDYFGWAVAADGDTIVVGAKEDDDGRGSVYGG